MSVPFEYRISPTAFRNAASSLEACPRSSLFSPNFENPHISRIYSKDIYCSSSQSRYNSFQQVVQTVAEPRAWFAPPSARGCWGLQKHGTARPPCPYMTYEETVERHTGRSQSHGLKWCGPLLILSILSSMPSMIYCLRWHSGDSLAWIAASLSVKKWTFTYSLSSNNVMAISIATRSH